MYCVYRSQGQGPIILGVTSLDRFSGTIKTVKSKLGTHMGNGLMYLESGPMALIYGYIP